MNFREAESYLLSLGNEVETMKLGLDNIRKLLAALGDPQNNYLKVQVAGTNGKGSVCAFLRSICLEAGIKAGVFTSPHLISITERINIGGVEIGEDDLARFATTVRETSEQLFARGEIDHIPTFFEQITAIALLSFADAKAELAILETGLGGRLDATTAANAEIAALTRIDYDHQQYLGESLSAIAAEKAAIIRADSIAVVAEQAAEASRAIVEHCKRVGVSPKYGDFVEVNDANDHLVFATDLAEYSVDKLGLAGIHQIENAKVALLVAEHLARRFTILQRDITAGFENARHPGRLERIENVLLDGAHNVGSAKALARSLDEFDGRPITLIFGAMNDKNVSEILAILAPCAERIIVTQPANSRSFSFDELLEKLPTNMSKERVFATDNVMSAIGIANGVTPDSGLVLVTGSLYLVGEVKKLLRSQI